jgi:hypothetical protein
MSVPSLGGGRYSIVAVDFKTRYILHDVLRHKSEAPKSFKHFLIQIRDLCYLVQRVRVDNDSVLLSVEFTSLLDEFGIALQQTAPFTHWQHGRIERQWGTLIPMALAMIHGAGLDRSYCALAMHAATCIRNRVWGNGADGVPYPLVTDLPPNISRLRVFGCPCYVHIDKQLRRKLDDRAWKGVFVGYALDSPAYLAWNPTTRRMVRSRNVEFDELATVGSIVIGKRFFHETSEDSDNNDGATVKPREDTADSQSGEQEASPQSAVQVEDIQLGEPEQQPPCQSERASRPSKQWWVVERPFANIASTNGINVPASYKQALRSAEWSHWQEAIDTEYKSLQERQTWSLVVKPAGRKIVDSKWVFKIKRNSDGTIARYKARFVARGFTQEHGIDYTETFAPTVKFSTIRVIQHLQRTMTGRLSSSTQRHYFYLQSSKRRFT